jgi:hypothetical protein
VLGFPDSIEQVNAPRLEGCAATAATATISSPWGPIQASSSLAQQVQHVNQQQPVYQQQQQAEASLDPLLCFPFPNLAPQVSATHQAQDPQPQNPIELDLYQYNSSHQGLVDLGLAPPPRPQGQVYIQQQSSSSSEFDQAINYNSNSSMMAAAVAPMDGVSAVSQYPIQQATTNTHGMPMQKYPEITPSPPLQHPPTSIHGAPTLMPFTVGTSSYQQELQNQHNYPIQGIGMALDQHQPSHIHQQISRPIAIGGRDSFPQDNSWSMLSNSGNRRTFGSTR